MIRLATAPSAGIFGLARRTNLRQTERDFLYNELHRDRSPSVLVRALLAGTAAMLFATSYGASQEVTSAFTLLAAVFGGFARHSVLGQEQRRIRERLDRDAAEHARQRSDQ